MGPGITRSPRLAARLLAHAWALAGLLLVPAQALAQQAGAPAATAQVQAAILTRGTIAKTADMDFGSIAQTNAAGTVVLSPESAATCTVTGGLIHAGGCRAARFGIYARRNDKVRIRELDGGQITLAGPGGATMLLTDLTMDSDDMTPINGAKKFDFGHWQIVTATGVAQFYVGGTLNVGAAQTPGVYNGTLDIEIQFN